MAPKRPIKPNKRRPLSLVDLPLMHILSFLYPEQWLLRGDREREDCQLARMAERMRTNLTHNHEAMVLGQQTLRLLNASGEFRGETRRYRHDLVWFLDFLSGTFRNQCIWRHSPPRHESRLMMILVRRMERKGPICQARQFALEQCLLRSAMKLWGRRHHDKRLEEMARLDQMTSLHSRTSTSRARCSAGCLCSRVGNSSQWTEYGEKKRA